ncbi:MAG: hypothetical protein AAGF12_42005 [Myxococcota bacterium]
MSKLYTAGVRIQTPDTPALSDRGDGALGCFVQTADGKPALLSCSHVLFPGFAAVEPVGVYSPSYTSCCGDDPIARTVFDASQPARQANPTAAGPGPYWGGWREGQWTGGFAFKKAQGFVPGPNGPTRRTDLDCWKTDCGIALLEPGVQFKNVWQVKAEGVVVDEIELRGEPITRIDIEQLSRPNIGETPTPDHYVRVYSPRTGKVMWGTLMWKASFLGGMTPEVDECVSDDSDASAGMLPSAYSLWILPRPKPEHPDDYRKDYPPLKEEPFGFDHGDSGSIVIDHRNRIIGMVIRKAPFNAEHMLAEPTHRKTPEARAMVGQSLGIATPIYSILDHLNVTIPFSTSKPVFEGTVAPTRGEPAYISVRGLRNETELAAHRQGIRRLREGLLRSRRGRLLVGLIGRHRAEVRWLFKTVRAISAAWRELEGPAFYHHALRSVADSEHAVPQAINGVSRQRLLDVLVPRVRAHASPTLARDLDRYGSWAEDTLTPLSGFHDAPTKLQAAWRPR